MKGKTLNATTGSADYRLLQILDDARWIDVICRARSDEGFKRVYRRLCRANPKGPPYGMRIITVHCEHLGRLPNDGQQAGGRTVKMRKCQDVPRFLAKFDEIQKRTSKSKLILGLVVSAVPVAQQNGQSQLSEQTPLRRPAPLRRNHLPANLPQRNVGRGKRRAPPC